MSLSRRMLPARAQTGRAWRPVKEKPMSQNKSLRSYPFDKSRESPEAIVSRARGNHKENGNAKDKRITPH